MTSEWNGKRCPVCGEGFLHDTITTEKQFYRGATYESKSINAVCDICGDGMSIYDEKEELSWIEFKKRVDSSHLENFKYVRSYLGLTQKQVAEIVGGGVNAVSRYERGESTPSIAAINLMGLLHKYPRLIGELSIGAIPYNNYERVSNIVLLKRKNVIPTKTLSSDYERANHSEIRNQA